MRARVFLFAFGCLALAGVRGAPAAAGTFAPSQCASQKYKAAGAYAKARAACEAKAAAKGIAVEASCLTRALAKLQKKFEKADAGDDCAVTGNAGRFENETDAYFAEVEDVLTTPPICCATPGGAGQRCFYTFGSGECAKEGGVPGAEGSVCHGAGACVVPPVNPGACCESEGGCVTGAIEAFQCAGMEGDYFEDAFCLPSGDCVPAE